MKPKQTTGLDLIRKFLTSGLGQPTQRGGNKTQFKFNSQTSTKKYTGKASSRPNPINALAKGLTSSISGLASTVSRITKKTPKEDYNKIVKSFLPSNTVLLKPQYPADSNEIQFSDLDGDASEEIIASYRLGNEIRTIILKKQNSSWIKAGEFSAAEYDTLNYRDAADMIGDGKKQIVMGYTSKLKLPSIRAYSFDKNILKEIFNKNYHRFEVVKKTINKKAKVAVWNRNASGTYDIDLFEWNGQQVEALKNTNAYYRNYVIPQYAMTVKNEPRKAEHWLNFADALVKAGMNRDAMNAISIGTKLDKDSQFRDKFQTLKDLM